ncbi:MAG: EF-P lysine aminoacylase GenX [Alphaproteobacteria bacterium]|nr:EF-P lysine aminoacylase GenX [Alphaproteobacteria bacterium]
MTSAAPPRTPWWRPDRYAARRGNLLKRAAIARALRDWFATRDFVEVETPALQVSPGLEPHLRAFATMLLRPGESTGPTLRLHTSPEFAMKKLLVAGEPRLFQLARVFRNGEAGTTHHPEFTMLEWYRAGSDYAALMDDCAAMLRLAADAAGAAEFRWHGRTCDPRAEPERLSVQGAFERHCGIDLLATAPDPRSPDVARLARAAAALGVTARADDRWDDLFFRIFLDHIEPKLGIGRATLLHDYPISMAALSRAKPSDPRVAERVELYVAGLELANGFSELVDAEEQRRRFEADMDLKQRLYGERYPIDEDFLAALRHGLPACAGMALGFDRLAMLACGAADIESVLWAPVTAP